MAKVVVIPNYNNKLMSDIFCHVASPPANAFVSSDFPIRVAVRMDGGSMTFYANIISLVRFGCYDAPSSLCMMSHGMDGDEIVKWWIANVEGGSVEDDLCAYIFKKVDSPLPPQDGDQVETKTELF